MNRFSLTSLVSFTLLIGLFGCSQAAPTPVTVKKSSGATADSKKKSSSNNTGSTGSQDASSDDDSDENLEDDSGDDDMADMEKPIEKPIEKPKEEVVIPKEPTPKENVAALDGFRWEMPCERMDGNELCFSNIKVDQTKMIGGKTTDLYEVELRFRGVVEPMMYKDGQKIGDRFYVGGLPNNPTYNIYAIEVSSPKQVYYLNWANGVGHDTFSINYTAKIKVNGGASIHLLGDGQNDKMIANFKNAMAPDIEKLPDGNKGQFIQMNVVDAVLIK